MSQLKITYSDSYLLTLTYLKIDVKVFYYGQTVVLILKMFHNITMYTFILDSIIIWTVRLFIDHVVIHVLIVPCMNGLKHPAATREGLLKILVLLLMRCLL